MNFAVSDFLRSQNIEASNSSQNELCDACQVSKSSKAPANTTNPVERCTRKLQKVYSDICGPFPKSLNGCKYMINFVDDFSRYSAVYFLQAKSQALGKLEQFCAEIGIPETLRTDNGGEYTSTIFKKFCIRKKHQSRIYSPIYAPPTWRS